MISAVHNVLFVQYLFLATEQGGNDITLPYCDIIQHILIPARSVARKTLLWAFLWASNSKFAILSELYPCNNYRAIKYPPVSIEFGIEYPPVSHTLLIQGDNLSPCIIYRAFLNTGGSYCTNSTLCTVVHKVWSDSILDCLSWDRLDWIRWVRMDCVIKGKLYFLFTIAYPTSAPCFSQKPSERQSS